ncbi:MAG: pyridoxamine 5'-phosphate oxidase family protein [Acetatifactor sp.]
MNQDGLNVMKERFGRDNVIILGTINGEYPALRHVNAYYEDGAFYVITYALSNKMQQIGKNPNVSICAEWFSARGKAVSLGYFGKEENKEMAEKLRKEFATWIDNGHNNFEDENTIILRIDLVDCVLFSYGTRYDIHF